MTVCADVNQTEPGDDVGGLKGSNVNHNNLPNSEPGTGAPDAAAVSAPVYILCSGWVQTIYIAEMGVGVARDAVRHVSL